MPSSDSDRFEPELRIVVEVAATLAVLSVFIMFVRLEIAATFVD